MVLSTGAVDSGGTTTLAGSVAPEQTRENLCTSFNSLPKRKLIGLGIVSFFFAEAPKDVPHPRV